MPNLKIPKYTYIYIYIDLIYGAYDIEIQSNDSISNDDHVYRIPRFMKENTA